MAHRVGSCGQTQGVSEIWRPPIVWSNVNYYKHNMAKLFMHVCVSLSLSLSIYIYIYIYIYTT